MGVSKAKLDAQLAEVDSEIAKLLNEADPSASVAEKAARKAAFKELKLIRSRVIQMQTEAAAKELAGHASTVSQAAADAERKKVENVLNSLKQSFNAALEDIRTMMREIEAAPVDTEVPVAETAPPVMEAPEINDPVLMRKPKAGQAVYGHLVLAVQKALTASGFDTQGVDMSFGPNTAAALSSWHAATGEAVPTALSAQEWKVLVGSAVPDLFDLCAQLTAAFEGHGFQKAVGDFDGAIATWGYHGYTLKFGHLQNVLKQTEAAQPGILSEVFGANKAQALQTMLAMGPPGQIAWGKANLVQGNGAIVADWALGLAEIGARPVCQQVQLDYSRKEFWERIALPQVNSLGLKDALSHAILFDTAIQQGGLGATAMAKVKAAIAANPEMPESAKRAEIAKAAVASVGQGRFRDDVKSRRETFIHGQGKVHGKTYDLSCWGLAAAFDEKETLLAATTQPAAPLVSFAADADFETWFEKHVKPVAPNFEADEFLRMGASNAPGARCAGMNRPPPKELWPNCIPLAKVLQEFRNNVGASVTILGMYRAPEYNECVGGASKSQHMQFCAADIRAPSAGKPSDWRKALLKLRNDGVFLGGVGLYDSFVHVDTRGENADWTG